ncbi:MAG: hypothetical protein QW469_01475 [Candidatus Aenigmatarchaeota archaeon]
MISEEELKEKIKEGWIKLNIFFEVLAINKETAENSLNSLFEKFEKEQGVKIYSKKFGESSKVLNPMKGINEAWSSTLEITCIVKNFETAINLIIVYGPSAIEIIEPKELKININAAQTVLNSVAGIMHQFAAAGIGGIVFVNPKSEKK